MNETNNKASSPSANDDTRHRINEQRLSFSPIISPPSPDRNGDNDDDENNANYENPPAADVEEYFSVRQSMLPPSPLENSDKKQPRPRRSQDVRANDVKADSTGGGSRLLKTASLPTIEEGNNRTCLLDSISEILPPTIDRRFVRSAVASCMPKEGDTSVKNIKHALADNGLILQRVGGKYIKKGGAPFHLLKERNCKIIVNIKLLGMVTSFTTNRTVARWTIHMITLGGL